MMDDPEVTIEPADNGYLVRHYRRSTKKDEGGRTIRQVASTVEDALGHARRVLGGTGRAAKKSRARESASENESTEATASPSSSSSLFGRAGRSSVRRRRPRSGGRR